MFALWRSAAFCVYDWSLWRDMLVTSILPRARRIAADFEQSPRQLLAKLPRRAKTLLIHLDISDNAPFIADAAEFISILTQREIRVLNCRCRDIRKTTVQSHCIRLGLPSVTAAATGLDDELLIVKSDLNSGGEREQKLSDAQKARFNLPAAGGRITGPADYRVTRRADLPRDTWNDPHLVVEQYIKNTLGRFFRVYVALNAIVISEAYDDALVKRMAGPIRRCNHRLWRHGELLHPQSANDSKLPPRLLHTAGVFVDSFHVDYGAIDIVESAAGDFYVVDVNKTPYWGDEKQAGLIEHLRLGFFTAKRR
ncbi:MAG TPA: hypothetical protein VHX86_05000 [Tepidisphaeraceae bacterium]|jgi:hypothetical protein|nr:hypothetical protein [Tepidisphaeraceae bacterium]